MAQERNGFTEEQATPKQGFFQRMMQKYGAEKEQPQEEAAEAEEIAEEKPQEPELPAGRGVVRVAEQSLLYSLWQEWRHNSSGEELCLIMEKPGEKPVDMEDDFLDAEKQRMLMKLLMESKKRHRQVHPKTVAEMTPEELAAPPVIPDLDANAVIYISKGAMGAWITLFPPYGAGKPLTKEDLAEILEAESIVFGVDEERLERLAEEPVYFDPVLIARGLREIPGKDGWVKEYYARELESGFAMDEAGNMDYRSAVNMQVVHAGDVICEAFPPTEGIPGKKVTGTELPAASGKEVKLPRGTNTHLNEEQNQLLASKDGSLQYIRECFCVQPLFQVNGDVDYGVGNIDFPGDVRIYGDVRNGFVVKAKGDIVIDGLVEGAILEAGGNISIRKGVLGDDRAVISAQKSVSAQYLENCVVYAGDRVETSSIITSDVNSDNAIVVRSGRGTIIGGKLVATNLISATVIGCRAERVTELIIGEVPMLKQEREELLAELDEVQKEEAKLGSNINYLDVDDPEEDADRARNRARMLAKFRLQRSVLTVRKEQIRKRLEDLKQKETDASKCRVVCDTLYPVTKVYFGDICRTIDRQEFHCSIHMEDDGLVTH